MIPLLGRFVCWNVGAIHRYTILSIGRRKVDVEGGAEILSLFTIVLRPIMVVSFSLTGQESAFRILLTSWLKNVVSLCVSNRA